MSCAKVTFVRGDKQEDLSLWVSSDLDAQWFLERLRIIGRIPSELPDDQPVTVHNSIQMIQPTELINPTTSSNLRVIIPSGEPSPEQVSSLSQIGFPQSDCLLALRLTGNNLDEATQLLLDSYDSDPFLAARLREDPSKAREVLTEWRESNPTENIQQWLESILINPETIDTSSISTLPKRSAESLKKAADGGDAKSAYRYGIMLSTGDGVAKNSSEAAKYFYMGAERGHAGALFEYSKLLDSGNGVERDIRLAARYLHIAADKGCGEARYEMGRRGCFYKLDESVKQPALRYLKLAGDRGHGKAAFLWALAIMSKTTSGTRSETLRYLKIAANCGIPGAQVTYAHMLEGNPEESARYYKMGGDHGCSLGSYLYGHMILQGEIKRERKEGMRYLKMAADAGSVIGAFEYAIALPRKDNYEKQEYARYIKVAADRGSVEAREAYAQCLLVGFGVKQNRYEAYRMLERNARCLGRDNEVLLELCFHQSEIHSDEEMKALEEKAKQGDGNAKLKLMAGKTCWLDTPESPESLKDLADSGSASAQFQYGLKLYLGDGVSRNPSLAATYFKESADQGDINAAFAYGYQLFLGKDITTDYGLSAIYLKRAADAGFRQAAIMYGLQLVNGDAVPPNPFEAMRYFKMASDNGSTDAACSYSAVAVQKCGCPEDGIRCLKMASDSGNIWAALAYQCMIQGQPDYGHYLKMIADGGISRMQVDYASFLLNEHNNVKESLRYLEMAADFGEAMGVYWGEMTRQHRPDYLTENLLHLKEEADRGDPESAFEYANQLGEVGETRVQKSEIARYYQIAADRDPDNAEAQFRYGLMLFNGEGVAVNKSRAAHYMRMAADQGHPTAAMSYARLLFEGTDVDTDKFRGLRYAGIALKSGGEDPKWYHDHSRMLWEVLESGEPVASFYLKKASEHAKYVKRAADGGDSVEQYFYGRLLFDGKGVEKNVKEAARYFKLSADQGYGYSQLHYGLQLLEGVGVECNAQEASRYFKLAADQGISGGEFFFGLCLYHGLGVGQDFKGSVEYFRRSAFSGHSRGQFYYGFCLYYGKGHCVDEREGFRYLRLSAEQGYCEAELFYGCCLQGSESNEINLSKSRILIKRSSDQGYCDGVNTDGVYDLLLSKRHFPSDFDESDGKWKRAGRLGSMCGRYNHGVYLLYAKGDESSVLESIEEFKHVVNNVIDSSFAYDYEHILRHGVGVDSVDRWKYIKSEADFGYPEAQYIYGKHLYGLGGCDNFEESLKYFKLAADQKHSEAAFAFGVLQLYEVGSSLDSVRPYYDLAIRGGVLAAQYQWGMLLCDSADPRERRRAAECLKMASEEILLRKHFSWFRVEWFHDVYHRERFFFTYIPERLSDPIQEDDVFIHFLSRMERLEMPWSAIRNGGYNPTIRLTSNQRH